MQLISTVTTHGGKTIAGGRESLYIEDCRLRLGNFERKYIVFY